MLNTWDGTNQERIEALVKRLSGMPGWFEQAEDAVAARMRTLGQSALQEWMLARCEQLNAVRPHKARKDSKTTAMADDIGIDGG